MLAIGITAMLFVYTMMLRSWWDYVATNNMDYFLGLPQPTAWMLFGIMLTPFFIALCYTTQFENWIYTPEDEKQFAKIMDRRRSRSKY